MTTSLRNTNVLWEVLREVSEPGNSLPIHLPTIPGLHSQATRRNSQIISSSYVSHLGQRHLNPAPWQPHQPHKHFGSLGKIKILKGSWEIKAPIPCFPLVESNYKNTLISSAVGVNRLSFKKNTKM